MTDRLCFNKSYFILLSIAIVVILFYQFLNLQKKSSCPKLECPSITCPTCPKCPECPTNNNGSQNPQPSIPPPAPPIPPAPPLPPSHPTAFGYPSDIVRNYDYHKTYDPLEEPARRVARYDIPPYHMKRIIDIPSRGYPDNFTQFGILVKQGDPSENKNNKILRLFGRQQYPGSYRYEYYTALNSGHDQIKIPVETRAKKELYDGDVIHINELGEEYKVQLHKYDSPKYYPDLIY